MECKDELHFDQTFLNTCMEAVVQEDIEMLKSLATIGVRPNFDNFHLRYHWPLNESLFPLKHSGTAEGTLLEYCIYKNKVTSARVLVESIGAISYQHALQLATNFDNLKDALNGSVKNIVHSVLPTTKFFFNRIDLEAIRSHNFESMLKSEFYKDTVIALLECGFDSRCKEMLERFLLKKKGLLDDSKIFLPEGKIDDYARYYFPEHEATALDIAVSCGNEFMVEYLLSEKKVSLTEFSQEVMKSETWKNYGKLKTAVNKLQCEEVIRILKDDENLGAYCDVLGMTVMDWVMRRQTECMEPLRKFFFEEYDFCASKKEWDHWIRSKEGHLNKQELKQYFKEHQSKAKIALLVGKVSKTSFLQRILPQVPGEILKLIFKSAHLSSISSLHWNDRIDYKEIPSIFDAHH
jgi:hypothetical protein